MDAMKHSNDFKLIDSERDEVESSHLQLGSTSSNSQSKEVVESNHLHLDSLSSQAQSLVEVGVDDLLMDSTPSEAQSVVGEILLNGDAQVGDNHASNSGQCSHDPQVAYVENAQVVDNNTSDSGQCSYDPYLEDVVPLPLDSNTSFTYNGVTYFTYEAFEEDFHRQLLQEREMDNLAAQRRDDIGEPQFSDCMVHATGGSPAVINPHNGLPWREGANLCRPYMDEGCCRFGTACIFHHPWPPTEEELP